MSTQILIEFDVTEKAISPLDIINTLEDILQTKVASGEIDEYQLSLVKVDGNNVLEIQTVLSYQQGEKSKP